MTHTVQSLTAFTDRVKQAFLEKRIKAPVHLCDPAQAEPLIESFKDVKPKDYVFAGWRSSFHALLKGIPEEVVFAEILAGRSMYLMNKEYRLFCSSIVGGILPIALGVAMSMAGMERGPKVHVYIGDMGARTGLFYEFLSYCEGHDLPVRVVVEDNGLSTNSPTSKVWGGGRMPVEQDQSGAVQVPTDGGARRCRSTRSVLAWLFGWTNHCCQFHKVRRHFHPTVMQDSTAICWECGKVAEFSYVCRDENGIVYLSSNANDPQRIPGGIAYELFGEYGEVTNEDKNVNAVLGRGFEALCKEVGAK